MAESSKKPTRILVVDDEQIVLSLLSDALSDVGYEVTSTISAVEAIEMVRTSNFDFIMTDIRMPEMNGIDLVKKVHEIRPTIGVIFMTGYANLDTAKQAIKEGAYDYIMKPFELVEVRQAIARAVEKKKQSSEATLSDQLNKIADLSKMIYTSGDSASLLELSLSFAILQGDAQGGMAFYYNRAQERLTVKVAGDVPCQPDGEHQCEFPASQWDAVPIQKSCYVLADENGHPLSKTDLFQECRDKILPRDWRDSKSVVIIPLIRSSRLMGFLTLFHQTPDYQLKQTEVQFLNFISSQLSISLENLELLEASQEAYRRLEYLQDQTIHLEKMATRGQMSAEIGHELNNYLGVVVANFQLMNKRLQRGITDDLDRYTSSIEVHLDKISNFCKRLMDYAAFKASFSRDDINDLIGRVVEFLRPQKRFRHIEFALELQDSPVEAEIDTGLIEQLLYNLLNNAADAMKDAETKLITLRTGSLANGSISFSVSDTGAGIAAQNLQRIFHEKFTTKDSGHGIGIIVCKNIIDRHHGDIAVESVPGGGTTFTITLPTTHEDTQRISRPTTPVSS
jgi:signal transduction histidine kinase/CheY-like chemotaxis protein